MVGGLGQYQILKLGQSFTKVIPLNRGHWSKNRDSMLSLAPTLRKCIPPIPKTLFPRPITIDVKPRTDKEMDVYIAGLTNQIAALVPSKDYRYQGQMDSLVMKLMFHVQPRRRPWRCSTQVSTQPRLFGNPRHLQFYVPRTGEVNKRSSQPLPASVCQRDAASSLAYGCTNREELMPIIARSLAPDNTNTWQLRRIDGQRTCR